MGATPLAALVALCVPGGSGDGQLTLGVMEGVAEASRASGCAVVGGDVSGGNQLVVSVTVLGTSEPIDPPAVARIGAQPGDVVLVTGPCGASAAGLREPAAAAAGPTRPGWPSRTGGRWRVCREGRLARLAGAHAMMDVSDGLALDLHRLAAASAVGLELDSVPVAAGATEEEALGGGEDYELLIAIDVVGRGHAGGPLLLGGPASPDHGRPGGGGRLGVHPARAGAPTLGLAASARVGLWDAPGGQSARQQGRRGRQLVAAGSCVRRGGLVTLPARMHEVQTCSRLGAPSTMARTRWMFGSQRRLVRRWEWLTFMPNEGFLPQMSHTAAIGETFLGEAAVTGPRRPSRTGQRLASLAMTSPATLGADDLRAVMGGYRDALRLHQADINRLNVYPVPDGDTGTNMALTLEAVVSELQGIEDGAGLLEVCRAIGHGSLMGARGNSGVILSQLLRGMSERMGAAGEDGVGPDVLVDAIGHASELARRAVVRPVEGTILTVAAAAASGSGPGFGPGRRDGERPGRGGRRPGRTPEMLPVLAQAGVVDAGGSGYLLLLDAFLLVLDGRPLPEPSGVDAPDLSNLNGAWADQDGTHGEEHAVGDLRYEVMYFLHAPDDSIEFFKDVWAGIGDSIVVVGGDGLWNCHIHTNDIGAAIEAGVDTGRPHRIRVTDLDEQVEEERWVRESVGAAGAGAGTEDTGPPPPRAWSPSCRATASGASSARSASITWSWAARP